MNNKFGIFPGKKYYFPILIIFNVLLQILFIPSLSHPEGLPLRAERVIREGTEYQTVAHFFYSGYKGPTVMIMAGVHGDELAGIKASKKLMEHLKPELGTVIIIPEANKKACDNRVRAITPEDDLNRNFPGDHACQGISGLAAELFEIMEANQIDFLLDLHESVKHYQKNPSYYGQTIILDDHKETFLLEISEFLVNELNRQISLSKNNFQVIVEPIEGCSTYEALNLLGIPGITFETSTQLELSKRVSLHYLCIKKILSFFEVISLY